jgi:hypothetical protein
MKELFLSKCSKREAIVFGIIAVLGLGSVVVTFYLFHLGFIQPATPLKQPSLLFQYFLGIGVLISILIRRYLVHLYKDNIMFDSIPPLVSLITIIIYSYLAFDIIHKYNLPTK